MHNAHIYNAAYKIIHYKNVIDVVLCTSKNQALFSV